MNPLATNQLTMILNRLGDLHRSLNVDPSLAVNLESFNPKVLQLYDLLPRQVSSRCPMAYTRPYCQLLRKDKSGSSIVKADKDKFRVDLDVQQFAPEEITVKVVDRFVIVEGKHEEKQDEHGWVSRQFTRRYMIPSQCDLDQVSSQLSSDHILSIIVPRKEQPASEGERVINIEHTGKPALSDAQKEEKKEQENAE